MRFSLNRIATATVLWCLLLPACAPANPGPAIAGTATPSATPTAATSTPPPISTATLPPPQFPDTPAPSDTPAPTATPVVSPTPTPAPTVTPTSLAGDYQLNIIYQWNAADDKFTYMESTNAAAQFTVARNGTIAGSGSGIYSQGLRAKNPNVNCGVPLNLPVKLDVQGKSEPSQGRQVLHLQVEVKFSGTATADIYCQAAGIRVDIAPVASVDVLTQRAAALPWSDFTIDTTLGLFSTLYDGPGIDWKRVGSGDVTMRVKPLR